VIWLKTGKADTIKTTLFFHSKQKNAPHAALPFSARNAVQTLSGKRKTTVPKNVHAQGQ
jgi:hypothetical protein